MAWYVLVVLEGQIEQEIVVIENHHGIVPQEFDTCRAEQAEHSLD